MVRGQCALRCSTPFGITAVGSWRVCHIWEWLKVLNAFRHHGCREDPEGTSGIRNLLCSTPFGITAVGRVARKKQFERDRMCSTPFGITAVGSLSLEDETGMVL